MPAPTYLTTAEAAEFLGMHKDSVSRLARLGDLPYELSPKGYIFRLSMLKKFKPHVRSVGNPGGFEACNEWKANLKWRQ